MKTIKETDSQCTKGHYLEELTLKQFDKISVKLHNRITPKHDRITNHTRVSKCRTELKKGNGPCKIHVSGFIPVLPRGSDTYITSQCETDSAINKQSKPMNNGCIIHANDIKHSCDHHFYIPRKRTTSTKRFQRERKKKNSKRKTAYWEDHIIDTKKKKNEGMAREQESNYN